MASSEDNRNAESARAHIEAAIQAPHRESLELNQATAFANLIVDKSLKNQVLTEIRQARG